MKNKSTVFGSKGIWFLCAIALVVAGLTLAGCPADAGGGGTGNNNNGGNNGGGGGDSAAVTFGTVTYTESSGNCSAAFTYTGSDTPTAKLRFVSNQGNQHPTANPMDWKWNGDTNEDMIISSGTATFTGGTISKAKYTSYPDVYVVIKVGSSLNAKQYWYQLKPAP